MKPSKNDIPFSGCFEDSDLEDQSEEEEEDESDDDHRRKKR
jgi:hypothetical protein